MCMHGCGTKSKTKIMWSQINCINLHSKGVTCMEVHLYYKEQRVTQYTFQREPRPHQTYSHTYIRT